MPMFLVHIFILLLSRLELKENSTRRSTVFFQKVTCDLEKKGSNNLSAQVANVFSTYIIIQTQRKL